MEIFPGITMDAEVRFGKPCIKGTRIDVATILATLAAGESFQSIQDEFALSARQILDALQYASHIANHVPPAINKAA